MERRMPALRIYSVFVCHDWEYSDDYYRVCEFLDGAANFRWENRSVPEHDPLDTDRKLRYNLRNQIRPAHVLLVLAGMYTVRSRWMDWEMEFARMTGKPIIGIAPRGNRVLPRAVQKNATEVTGWRASSIVDAIRRHGR
jgi:hypothetical protein